MDEYKENLNDIIEKTDEIIESISELITTNTSFTLAKSITEQLREELINQQ